MDSIINPTKDFIVSAFKEYNAKYFDNKLVQPNFEFSNCKRVLGRCCRKRVYDGCFGGYHTLYTIHISLYYKRTKFNYISTLLHEMIHLYIMQQKLIDSSSHGQIFFKWANMINKDGWGIDNVSRNRMQSAKKHQYQVWLLEINADTYAFFLTSVNPSYYNEMVQYCESHFKSHKVIKVSDSETLHNYKMTRTRIHTYLITKEKYNKMLASADK